MFALDLIRSASTDPLRLYRYREGLYATDLLTAAVVHLDFFTWLAKAPADVPAICAQFDAQPRPVDVMLTLFAANGLVHRRGDLVEATALAREHLAAGSPRYLAPYYASLASRPVVADYLRVLRTGRPANWGGAKDGLDWHAAMATEPFARQFTAAMDCRGLTLAHELAIRLDLSARQRVLDVGGGSGIYACSLVAHYPHLEATVFDQSPVDRIAETLVAERGFVDRVRVAAGDFFREAWPSGHDVHLLSNVLHDWDTADAARLIAASSAALPPGGLLIIHDAFIDADKTGPLAVAEYSALLMHSTQGKCYSTLEYEEMLGAAGFTDCRFQTTALDRGVMTAKKPGLPG